MINFHPNFENKPLTIEEEKELFLQQTKEGITGLLALKKQLEESENKTPNELRLLEKVEEELEIYRKYIDDLKNME